MNKNRMIQEFQKLVSINSLSFHEREMADYLKARLTSLGFSVYEDDAGAKMNGEAGNVIGTLYNENPTDYVLFSAHMDTVTPGENKVAILHEDGHITSDGTTVLGADNLAAVAEILEAITEIIEEGLPHRDIEIVFPAAEEYYASGSAHLDLSKLHAKIAFVPDVSGPQGTVSLTEPTLLTFDVTLQGKASHAGFDPEKGISAIRIATKAIEQLPQGRVNANTTFNIGSIHGGLQTNITPEIVTLKGEIRSQNHEEALSLLHTVEETFQTTATSMGGQATIKHTIYLYAYTVDEDDPALLEYNAACKGIGITPNPKINFGGSDNNVYKRNGIHGITIACAMHDVHSVHEYTTVSEMEQAKEIIKFLMIQKEK